MPTLVQTAIAMLGLSAALFQAAPPTTALPPALGHPQAALFQAGDFSDAKTCKMCHTLQYEQWQGGMHSFATVDPYYLRAVKMARTDVPGIEQFCSACHAPVAVLSGLDPLDPAALTGAAAEGVTCDVCHSVSGKRQTGNFGYTLTPGTVKYGPFGAQPPIFHTTAQSALHDSGDFCGMCHDVTHPLNNLPLETTYSEWAAGPYAAEGVKCQDCHMTHGITKYEAFPGVSANGQQPREHIWTHDVAGGNTFVTALLGSSAKAEMAAERLRHAAQVKLDNIRRETDVLTFDVIVTNTGAGHKLPTGVTEERQVWVDAVVLAQDGTELAHFGQLDERGVIAEDTMILQTKFGDAQGQATHRIWLAQSVLSDRRIAPRGSDTQSFSLPLAAGAVPEKIFVRLLYRSSHQDFIDELFADTPEREEVPIVEMAVAHLVF